MKNRLFIILVIIGITACNRHSKNLKRLQAQIDSLQIQLGNTYKPGFGEFMTGIQIHHAKLWFAGKNKNWKLADFEVQEIMEAIENIQKFQTERKESQKIFMINFAIDSVNSAIRQQNFSAFESNFVLLTNTCNNCHRVTGHEFNIVKIPDAPPFSNQVFKTQNEQ